MADMAATERPWPSLGESSTLSGSSHWTGGEIDAHHWKSSSDLIVTDFYNATVLQLAPTLSEDDLDDHVALEAQGLGLLPFQPVPDIDGITLATSAITFGSDSTKHTSTQSYSTAPTFCASSDQPPASAIQSPHRDDARSKTPTAFSDGVEKPSSPFRRGFRKMAGFRKRRSTALVSPTLSSISSDAETNTSGELSIKSDLKSPLSLKSSKSSWSQPLSAAKSSYEYQAPSDPECLKRSMDNKEMAALQKAQHEEKDRFLRYQNSLLAELRRKYDDMKACRRTEQNRTIAEQVDRKERALEELEAHQLEEELKIQKEHDLEKRAVMIRLRHMEAYCQNPTPPLSPVVTVSGRLSMDLSFPERKVTEKDYHSLAQQYRERDTMDTLHTSKINVLRGRQKKAVENLMSKRDGEIEMVEKNFRKAELRAQDDFSQQAAALRLAMGRKRARLEARWRTQALIERTKMEKATAQKYAPLPDVVAVEILDLTIPSP